MRNQYKFRRALFHEKMQRYDDGEIYLICNDCGKHINPAKEKWEADHTIAHYFDGSQGQVLCVQCHKEKTHGTDRPAIQKSKNTFDKHYGIKRKGWR